MIVNKDIDNGRGFDWGLTSKEYAKYRDIYPEAFYNKIINEGLCIKEQKVLDLGTGTGVLPRNLYQYGADFVGTDISEGQINEAIRLSKESNMNITYKCIATEDIEYADNIFDVITACQCFFYFNHDVVAKKLFNLLKPKGRLVILYMAWLPFEDKIAGLSEDLVLKYNPQWSGGKEVRHHNAIPHSYMSYFDIEKEEICDLSVPFTRETWNGRMIACRGIGASLTNTQVQEFNREHMKLLNKNVPDEFEVLHYMAITILRRK